MKRKHKWQVKEVRKDGSVSSVCVLCGCQRLRVGAETQYVLDKVTFLAPGCLGCKKETRPDQGMEEQ